METMRVRIQHVGLRLRIRPVVGLRFQVTFARTLGSALTVRGEPTLENLRLNNSVIPSYRITDIYGISYWLRF